MVSCQLISTSEIEPWINRQGEIHRMSNASVFEKKDLNYFHLEHAFFNFEIFLKSSSCTSTQEIIFVSRNVFTKSSYLNSHNILSFRIKIDAVSKNLLYSMQLFFFTNN